MEKKKLDELTKAKLIYSGMLVFFSIAFIVLGILQSLEIIKFSENFLNLFKFITLLGAAYVLYDDISTFVVKSKREKNCLIDKILTIFIPPYLIVIDIMLFANNEFVWNNPKYFITPLFFALAAIYLFQAVYHWFFPLKDLLEDSDEKPADNASDESNLKEEKAIDIDLTKDNDKKSSE